MFLLSVVVAAIKDPLKSTSTWLNIGPLSVYVDSLCGEVVPFV